MLEVESDESIQSKVNFLRILNWLRQTGPLTSREWQGIPRAQALCHPKLDNEYINFGTGFIDG